MLEEFGIDGKTLSVVKETIRSYRKFMYEILNPFEISYGICQEVGLSSLLFNRGLEKNGGNNKNTRGNQKKTEP